MIFSIPSQKIPMTHISRLLFTFSFLLLVSFSAHAKNYDVFVFGWDDTLLSKECTLAKSENPTLNPEKITATQRLETQVFQLLSKALEKGKVYIVTNSLDPWVQTSASLCFPKVAEILPKIKVISARSLFESRIADAPVAWKFYAFEEIVFENQQQNLDFISTDEPPTITYFVFDDTWIAREAIRSSTRSYSTARRKSFKLLDSHSVELLELQLTVLNSQFDSYVGQTPDLDLEFKSDDQKLHLVPLPQLIPNLKSSSN